MRMPDASVGSAVRRLGKPKPRDVLAGLVTGLFSIPEGMAYASIGGFNPVVGSTRASCPASSRRSSPARC